MEEVIRYLSDGEKNRTRALWERIFTEDGERFLDYYYQIKTADNEILVLEREGEILSMLQLNPYRLWLGDRQVDAAYVIAVATDRRYRHQGMMARLLERAMKDRREKGQPFLFLMPASDAIYRPFGFRYIYRQKRATGAVRLLLPDGERREEHQWTLKPVAPEEMEQAAKLAEAILGRERMVRTVRDARYYQVLKLECQAEDGDLCWMEKAGQRMGLVAYTREDALEVREPLLHQPALLPEALAGCFGAFYRPLYVTGIFQTELPQETVQPAIMARILDISCLLSGIRAVCPVTLTMELTDTILPENTGIFVWKVSPQESFLERVSQETGEKEAAPVTDVRLCQEELLQLLFPEADPDRTAALLERMTPTAREKWEKLCLYERVFINEVV